ncbi:MAG TPA: hypothetical protein VG964_00740 [Candidatus Saccharimonadales bacterium]|nr:hypothetical protein [Candidatus Saccharimonadales bacterium]
MSEREFGKPTTEAWREPGPIRVYFTEEHACDGVELERALNELGVWWEDIEPFQTGFHKIEIYDDQIEGVQEAMREHGYWIFLVATPEGAYVPESEDD